VPHKYPPSLQQAKSVVEETVAEPSVTFRYAKPSPARATFLSICDRPIHLAPFDYWWRRQPNPLLGDPITLADSWAFLSHSQRLDE